MNVERVIKVPVSGMGNSLAWFIETDNEGCVRLVQNMPKMVRQLRIFVVLFIAAFWVSPFLPWDESLRVYSWFVPFIAMIFIAFVYHAYLSEWSKWFGIPVLCEVNRRNAIVRFPRLDAQIALKNVHSVQIVEVPMHSDTDHEVHILSLEESHQVQLHQFVAYSVFSSVIYQQSLQVAKALAEAMDVQVSHRRLTK